MSDAARPNVAAPQLPAELARLEAAAGEAAAALALWHSRAVQAEAEVVRLRQALEEVGGSPDQAIDLTDQVRRLRAENSALRSRAAQAYRRVNALLSWLGALEVRR